MPGKTILASVVVDAVREISGAKLAFFYCKHSDPTRNSFISMARSILAQILDQDPTLLSYFHEIASTTDSTVLSSVIIAKRMLEMSFNSCSKLYIIIDGLDECKRGERKDISTWLQDLIQKLPAEQVNSLRCLIVSQDDGNARTDLEDFTLIKITIENHEDLRRFTAEWQKRIERRFGELRPENRQLANTIFVRAQGESALSQKRKRSQEHAQIYRNVHLCGTSS
jgi:NACHT domain